MISVFSSKIGTLHDLLEALMGQRPFYFAGFFDFIRLQFLFFVHLLSLFVEKMVK